MIRIEIKYIEDKKEGTKMSYSQPKATYSREKLIEYLEKYEKEMLR